MALFYRVVDDTVEIISLLGRQDVNNLIAKTWL
jgi:hypothetical protein